VSQEPPPASQRDLRAMIGDAVAFSAMVGLGETYVPAFALAVGLGGLAAGLVATLPMLAGAALQLVTPAAARRLGSYRRWVVLCARLQALCFTPLVVGALLGRIPAPVLFVSMAAYWGFGMGTGPAWNAWVGALVPMGERARFFARRARWAHATLLAAILAAGVALDRGAGAGRELAAFAALFAAALAARLLSSRFLAAQSEPPGLVAAQRSLSPAGVWRVLRGTDAGRLLSYLVAMGAAVHVAAPYFTPYMLGPLGLSYAQFTALTAAAFAARIAMLPLLGRLASARGSGMLFRIGAGATIPLPALWLVSDRFEYLLALQCLSGVAWGAVELGTLLRFFDGLADRERASILTTFNLANTLAIAAGSLIGGAALGALGDARPAYAVLFASSAAGRLAAFFLMPRTLGRGVRAMVLRTLAVRPSAGAIQRPILAASDDGPAPGGDPPPAPRDGP
jgi:MFS family permease